MMPFRRLSVLIITLLLLTGISGISAVAGAHKATTADTSVPNLVTYVTSLINSVGDDVFSTIDLSTLVSSTGLTAPTQLHTSTLAAGTQLDPSSSGTSTQHFGPYASGSSDSGTCGNNWADDKFDRHFTVFQDGSGSLLVVEQFKNGTFLTPSTSPPNSNQSPGACQTSPGPTGNGGTVAAGVTGSLHGYFVIPLPSGTTQTSISSSCVSGSPSTPCTTSGFINSHFTPACYPSTCPVTSFFFHYVAPSQGLIINEWKNASADRGGNSGDIRSA